MHEQSTMGFDIRIGTGSTCGKQVLVDRWTLSNKVNFKRCALIFGNLSCGSLIAGSNGDGKYQAISLRNKGYVEYAD